MLSIAFNRPGYGRRSIGDTFHGPAGGEADPGYLPSATLRVSCGIYGLTNGSGPSPGRPGRGGGWGDLLFPMCPGGTLFDQYLFPMFKFPAGTGRCQS